MTSHCDRHPDGVILQPSELVKAFGPTAGKLIPRYPGYGQVQRNDSQDPVYLSRLQCGHFLVSSPVIAAADELASEERSPAEFARIAYRLLLEKAHAGGAVSPAEVAAAQAAILVEERAEAGRKERAEAARIQAEQERREALEGPLRDELEESAANVQGARDDAFRALMALLDAVDEDMEVQDHAVAVLTGAGVDPGEVRPPANGFVQTTRAAGENFPFFPKAEHLIAVLQAVQYSRHRNSFTSTNGRELGKHIPVPIEGGPRVSPDVAEKT